MSDTQGGLLILAALGLWLWPHLVRWLNAGPTLRHTRPTGPISRDGRRP